MNNTSKSAKWWIDKYPFLAINDNSVYPWFDINSNEEHWLTDLPEGWINSFGEQMCDELMDALGKYVYDFIIVQTKEKFNELRLYWHWQDREYLDEEVVELNNISNTINDILHKYAEISYNTCTTCGAPATKWTTCGWILGFCDQCYERRNK